MPQLDKVHFFSQYFWLCVFYFGFYFLIVKHFLPKMARILQFRKNKLTASPQQNVGQELQLVQDSGKTALENVFTTSNKFWSHNSQRMQDWYRNQVRTLNNNSLKECNNLYIKKVGDYSLSQNAALGGITLLTPSATFVWYLTHKLKQPSARAKTGNDTLNLSNSTMPFSTSTSSKPVNKKLTRTGQLNVRHASSLESTSPEVSAQSSGAHNPATNKKGKKGKK